MTLAYLRLPGAPPVTRDVEYSERDHNIADTGLFIVDTGCAMDVSNCLSCPKDTEARFRRTMRVLRLTPYEHDSQTGLVVRPIAVPDDEAKESKQGSKDWPRLTMLMNTAA